jgi:DNA-binding transcriptional regulator YiaG
MTGAQLREAQRSLQLSNAQLCRRLGVAETTLCNWKADRIAVPAAVVLAMKYLQDLQDDKHHS